MSCGWATIRRFGAYNALLDEAAALHVRVRSFRAGDAFAFGDTQVNVLAPFRDYQPGAEPSNNDSLVLHVAYGANFGDAGGRRRGADRAGDAGRAGPREHAAEGGPSWQHHVDAAGVSGARGAAMGGDFVRACTTVTGIRARRCWRSCRRRMCGRSGRTLNGVSCFVLDGKSATWMPGETP